MTADELLDYADRRITALKLGPYGPLGTEFVVAYARTACTIRVSDGHGSEICRDTDDVDAALQTWVDWIDETR